MPVSRSRSDFSRIRLLLCRGDIKVPQTGTASFSPHDRPSPPAGPQPPQPGTNTMACPNGTNRVEFVRSPPAGVAEWQTRWIQNPVSLGS